MWHLNLFSMTRVKDWSCILLDYWYSYTAARSDRTVWDCNAMSEAAHMYIIIYIMYYAWGVRKELLILTRNVQNK